jgi:hypothetical protein
MSEHRVYVTSYACRVQLPRCFALLAIVHVLVHLLFVDPLLGLKRRLLWRAPLSRQAGASPRQRTQHS